MHDLWARAPTCAHLPDPSFGAMEWQTFLQHSEKWDAAIHELHSPHSVLDKVSSLTGVAPSTSSIACVGCPSSSFQCSLCAKSGVEEAFSTDRALQSHVRAKHGIKCQSRRYVDANGVCPSCGTQFGTRLRAIRHLSDSRRLRCWDDIMSNGLAPLSESSVEALDLVDRAARRDAQRRGKSDPIAHGPAITATGKVVGRVSV